jgi:hypothetical protein
MKQTKKSRSNSKVKGSKTTLVMPANHFKRTQGSKSQNLNTETPDKHDFDHKDQSIKY